MKNIDTLKDYEITNITQALKDAGLDTEDIVSVLLDGNWKYCDSDQELRGAYEEIYNKEFNSEDDFYNHIRFSKGIIFLDSNEGHEYLIKAKRKGETTSVNALGSDLKKRIVCQLVRQGLGIEEIVDIAFAQHKGYEWKYCEDALALKEAIENGYYTAFNPIITLHDDFGCSFLVCCKMN